MKAKDIAQKIFDEDPITRQTDTSFVFESGKRTLKKKFFDEFFDMNNLVAFDAEAAINYANSEEATKRKTRQRVKDYLLELTDQYQVASRPKLHSEAALANTEVLSQAYNFEDFTLFRSLLRENSGEMFVYDMVKNKLTDIDPEYYLKSLPKELRVNFLPRPCVFKYDPYSLSPTKIVEMYRQQVTQINLYMPPAWRMMETSDDKPICPKIIAKYLCHLFPDREARAYVICWLKNMILDKNNTYLGLNGFKGIGKNIFVELMCVALVGQENFGKGKLSLLVGQFNTVLRNNRLIFLDELKIDKKKHTVLKDIINPKQNIEAKGVDAHNVTDTHNSFVISNNDSHDVYVEHDDRRFSWMPMTKTPLKDAFTQDEVKELLAAFENPEIIKQLGEFILAYEHEVYEDPNYVWKCEKFHSLVYSSLYSWQQFLVDTLLDPNYKPMSISHMREDAEDLDINFPTNRAKVDNFLMNYMHRSEDRIGHMEKVDREWHIFSENIVTKKIEDDL